MAAPCHSDYFVLLLNTRKMPMPDTHPTISIRLPPAARRTLDKAVKATRRSRSYLMKEALERHLADIVREEAQPPRKPLAHLLGMAGVGASSTPRTAREIDAHIRWLRDDD
jgi:Arc/MetJ-type ribon-helix-helix transcriptional regulator